MIYNCTDLGTNKPGTLDSHGILFILKYTKQEIYHWKDNNTVIFFVHFLSSVSITRVM